MAEETKGRVITLADGTEIELRREQVALKRGIILTLRFDMDAWERIESEVCPLDELGEQLTKGDRLRRIAKLMAIMAAGEHPDEAGIWKAMWPGAVRFCTAAIWAAIEKGMSTEISDDDEEIDVTLKELEKKEETTG